MKQYNKNFVAYCKYNNIDINREDVAMWEFIAWVSKKAREFRNIHKLDAYHPISRLESWAEYIEKGGE
jgi:hypothetical protein